MLTIYFLSSARTARSPTAHGTVGAFVPRLFAGRLFRGLAVAVAPSFLIVISRNMALVFDHVCSALVPAAARVAATTVADPHEPCHVPLSSPYFQCHRCRRGVIALLFDRLPQ